jgi:predicted CoA-binding protein
MREQDAAIDAILRLLGSSGHIAVVGLSDKPDRPSNEVAAYLIRQGFSISPVNPSLDSVFDLSCHPDLKSIAAPVDVVDVFRRSIEAGPIVDDAIAIGARAVWLQEGVVDEDAARRARDAGLLVVMDRCLLKEHARRSF